LRVLRATKTWNDVLDLGALGVEGKSGIVDIKAGGSVQLAMYGLTASDPDGMQKLKDAFDPQIFDSAVHMAEALSRGSIQVIAAGESSSIITQWTKGAPIEWIYPSPTLGIVAAYGVAANAPHPAASQLFESWALSLPGQISFSKNGGFSPVPITPAIADKREFAKESWFHEPVEYFDADTKELSDAVPSLTEQFNKIFH
jgi:iron(III) transport system substrate-binding protein